MKHRLFFLVFLSSIVVAISVSGQVLVCQLGPSTGAYSPYWDQPPTSYASAELGAIASSVCPGGCGQILLVQNQSVSNAMTFSGGQGSKIAYNPAFMNMVLSQIGPQASFGILAHEFGHHLDSMNPASWMDGSWNRELRADAWAGCILARAGLQVQQVSVSLQAMAAFPSPTHPGWPQRLVALRSGYQQCGGVGSLQ